MEEHHLKKGERYKITVSLNLLESFAAPNDILKSQFEQHGFKEIEVYGEGKTRTVLGVWDLPDTMFSNKHIAEVEEIQ